MTNSMTRRDLVISAGLWVPAIVRIGSLMPVKSKIFVRSPGRIGLADRRHIALHVPRIHMLRKAGLSSWAIAAVLNHRGEECDGVRMTGPWSAGQVLRTIREASSGEPRRSAKTSKRILLPGCTGTR